MTDNVDRELDAEVVADEVEESSLGLADADEVLVLDEITDPNLHFEMWEPTGVPEVDAVLDDLSALPDLPIDEHARVFTSIHEGLREQLAQADGERTA